MVYVSKKEENCVIKISLREEMSNLFFFLYFTKINNNICIKINMFKKKN